MSAAFVFPGQGAQQPGMLHRLPAAGAAVLAEAAEVLGADPLELDTEAALASTRATQLSILLTSVAWARELCSAGARPDHLAGHSVGLWGAAVIAEAVDLGDAIGLVELRGTAMASASPPDAAMVAVDGIGVLAAESAAAQARATGNRVWVSTVNSPLQVTISGLAADVDALVPHLRHLGAQRVRRLAVAVPAHTPLLIPAETALRQALADTDLRRPAIPLAGNISGQRIVTAAQLRAELSAGVTRPVQWSKAMQILSDRGVRCFVQLPPGRSLVGLMPDGAEVVVAEETGAAEAARRLATFGRH
ncbi:ACP S-malonyltransferase [Gordonia sp. NPDC003424]